MRTRSSGAVVFAGLGVPSKKADRVERFEASGVFRLRRSIMGTDNAIAPLVLICASLAVAIAFSGTLFY